MALRKNIVAFICLAIKTVSLTTPFSLSGSVTVAGRDPARSPDSPSWLLGELMQPESVVDFHFNIFFNGTEILDSIDIIINGTSMKFVHSQQSVFISTKFGPVKPGLAKFQAYLDKPVFDDTRRTATAKLSNRGNPVESIYGNISMMLDEDESTNEQLRCQVTVLPYLNSGEILNRTVLVSEALLRPPPKLSPLQMDTKTMTIKDVATFNTNVTYFRAGFHNSYAKIYFPTTNHSSKSQENEAKISLVNFEVEKTHGLDRVTSDLLKSLKSHDFSNTGTSEKETSMIEFNHVDIKPMNKDGDMVIGLKANGRLQDYKDLKDKERLPIYMAFKSDEDVIWITRTHVEVDDDLNNDEKVPVLVMDLAENNREKPEKGIQMVRLRMTLEHDPLSNGTAYNITANIYLPPKTNIVERDKKAYDVVKPYSIVDSQDKPCTSDRVCHFEFSRISFPHVSRFYFNITINYDISKNKEEYDILYEIIYNGWRSTRDFSSSLKICKINGPLLPQDPAEEAEQNCPCLNDVTDQTCACCPSGSCQCVMDDPHKCVPCNLPWQCISTLQGYGKTSKIVGPNNTLICGDRRGLNPGKPWITCFERVRFNEFLGLSPMLGTLLGRQADTANLYGITNNGRGYVMSQDGGTTWYSIPSDVYLKAANQKNFVRANLT